MTYKRNHHDEPLPAFHELSPAASALDPDPNA
jgi:hypothetical protein